MSDVMSEARYQQWYPSKTPITRAWYDQIYLNSFSICRDIVLYSKISVMTSESKPRASLPILGNYPTEPFSRDLRDNIHVVPSAIGVRSELVYEDPENFMEDIKADNTDSPDGGFQAWTVVLGAWCCSFCCYGWINSESCWLLSVSVPNYNWRSIYSCQRHWSFPSVLRGQPVEAVFGQHHILDHIARDIFRLSYSSCLYSCRST